MKCLFIGFLSAARLLQSQAETVVCTSYTCIQSGWVLKATAASIHVATPTDADCCEAAPTCSTYTCVTPGWVKKDGIDSMINPTDNLCCEAPPVSKTTTITTITSTTSTTTSTTSTSPQNPPFDPAKTNAVPKVPKDNFHYVKKHNRICSGRAYTDHSSTGCNGWKDLSEVECQQKCTQNATADNCPHKECFAAALFGGGTRCHLFEPGECLSLMHENHVVIYEKVAHRSWFEETEHGMSKAMKTPVAKEVMGAGAAVTAAGVAAAGVAAALATRQQPYPRMHAKRASTTRRPSTGFQQANTTISAAVAAGDVVLQVVNSSGFRVGGQIWIDAGTPQQEGNVISQFGSLILQQPLTYAHSAGASVTSVGEANSSSLPPLIVPAFRQASTTPAVHSSSNTNGIGMPLLLSLVVVVCCCLSLMLTVCIVAARKGKRSRRSYNRDDYSSDESGSGSESEQDYEEDPHRGRRDYYGRE